MLSFLEVSLAESLMASVRDLAADASPRAFAVGIALTHVAGATAPVRRVWRRGRPTPQFPAAA